MRARQTCAGVLLGFSALCILSFAQGSNQQVLIGTVEKLSANDIQLKSNGKIVTIHTDSTTEIWNGNTSNGLSAVTIGSALRVTCRGNAGAKPHAIAVSTRINITGRVKSILPGVITVLSTSSSTGAVSAAMVHLSPGTSVLPTREKLIEGRTAQISGWYEADGHIDGEKITIHSSDYPRQPIHIASGQ